MPRNRTITEGSDASDHYKSVNERPVDDISLGNKCFNSPVDSFKFPLDNMIESQLIEYGGNTLLFFLIFLQVLKDQPMHL